MTAAKIFLIMRREKAFGAATSANGEERELAKETYPEAYVRFLVHFHGDRDYFECHELLEEYWKEHPDSPYRDAWVAMIQAAVGMYHYRRGNVRGAAKSFEGAIRRSAAEALRELGIEPDAWLDALRKALDGARSEPPAPFRDVDIPIADDDLKAECRARCAAAGFAWGAPSRLDDLELVDRHARRDRSDVIEARRRALARRADR